jgi:hypothetical protein
MAKVKIPKSIGGLKVPKAIRRSAMVRWVLNDPVGRTVAVEVAVAATGAASAAIARRRGRGLGEDGSRALDSAGHVLSAVSGALKLVADRIGDKGAANGEGEDTPRHMAKKKKKKPDADPAWSRREQSH